MTEFFQVFFNPAIVSLVVGIVGGIYTTLNFPAKLSELISYYLIFAIGFKGGACLGFANQCSFAVVNLAVAGLLIGLIQPFIHYFILKKTTALDRVNAAAVATQYGSISIITFITAVKFLNEQDIPYDTFMTAVAGLMEIPALFSGIFIIKKKDHDFDGGFIKNVFSICKSIFGCPKIFVIFIGFFVGLLLGQYKLSIANDIVLWPFNYILILFMIDIGIKIAKQRASIHHLKPALLAFGIYMPIINGCLGILIASKLVASVGSIFLFGILLASASYIAVPAVIRTQTSKAKEVIYLPLALGVTLPFNIIVGIPLFYYLSTLIAG